MSLLDFSTSESPLHHEASLAEFGLSTEIIHNAFRAGLEHARRRTPLALPGSPAMDLYLDTSEELRRILLPKGWKPLTINRQPRLVHPKGLLSVVVSSAANVGTIDDFHQLPVTGPKGPATRTSIDLVGVLAQPTLEFPQLDASDDKRAIEPPLWFLLHQLLPSELRLELSRPVGIRGDDCVDEWKPRVIVTSIPLDGDLSIFALNEEIVEYDVQVNPR